MYIYNCDSAGTCPFTVTIIELYIRMMIRSPNSKDERLTVDILQKKSYISYIYTQ